MQRELCQWCEDHSTVRPEPQASRFWGAGEAAYQGTTQCGRGRLQLVPDKGRQASAQQPGHKSRANHRCSCGDEGRYPLLIS